MPTFPTYDGKLPKYLNPLNPRHYLLIGFVVFPKLLIEHGVIRADAQGHYYYRVELMRQWVLRLQQRLT